ncbi:MAG TPA: tripartite tricarboxylate transporter substrate binding protein [Symbiobacteriaceae bacterium]|nr:tripartite tricarboxylate transporter substrate binding protein [Symbiobacteriaceae bacterium]
MRRIRYFAVLTLVAALLAACSGSKPAEPAKPATPAPAAAPAEKTWAPEKQVTLVVPYSAGGSSDLLARAVEKVWPKFVNQPLVVVNKAGAGGFEAREGVVRGAADGYTLMMGYGSGEDLVVPQLRKTNVDVFNDFIAVSRLSVHSVMIAVPANSEFKSIKDVVEWAKKNNKPVTAAVATAAGAVDIVMRGIGKAAGIQVTPVPHQGGSQAITTLVGGQTMIGGGHPPELIAHVKAGRLRIIGVATPERDPAMPDVPTLKEQGINFSTWGSVKGISVAKGTAPEIVKYYEDVFKKMTEDPDFKKTMADMVQPVQYQNSKDFTAFIKAAYDDYTKIIKDNDIKLAQ